MYAIKAALEDQKVTPDMSISDICEAMKKGMTNITMSGLTGDEMTWNASGEPNKTPKAMIIQDGKYVSAE